MEADTPLFLASPGLTVPPRTCADVRQGPTLKQPHFEHTHTLGMVVRPRRIIILPVGLLGFMALTGRDMEERNIDEQHCCVTCVGCVLILPC